MPPAAYDHVSPTDADYPPGVYRVVGTDDEVVTLLRITDGDGRRVHTGELVTADADAFGGFDPVARPVATRPLRARIASALTAGYWSFRAFGQQLRARPRAAAAAGTFVLIGVVGSVVPVPAVPDAVFGVLLFAGSLGLAAVGAGYP